MLGWHILSPSELSSQGTQMTFLIPYLVLGTISISIERCSESDRGLMFVGVHAEIEH